ncbi:MAG: hypothetical protein IT454_18615 [Planctomycetes bacterium]|nr:hypothetical protein [Planctomycetota bacterium]
MLGRALAVWLAIIALESAHGAARIAWLEPRVGDLRARQLCVFSGMALIFIVSRVSIRWLAPRSAADAWRVGILWLLSTLAFEVALGRCVAKLTWERILSDYDPSSGGLLAFGMAFLCIAPWLAARSRNMLRG